MAFKLIQNSTYLNLASALKRNLQKQSSSRRQSQTHLCIEYHPIGVHINSNNLLVALGIQTNPKFDLSAPSLPRGKSLLSPIPSIQISSNRPSWRPWQLIQFRLIFPRRFLHPKAISSSRRPCSPSSPRRFYRCSRRPSCSRERRSKNPRLAMSDWVYVGPSIPG